MSEIYRKRIREVLEDHQLDIVWEFQDYDGCTCGKTFTGPHVADQHLDHLESELYDAL